MNYSNHCTYSFRCDRKAGRCNGQVKAGECWATVHYEVSKVGYVTQSGDIKTLLLKLIPLLKKEITLVKAQE